MTTTIELHDDSDLLKWGEEVARLSAGCSFDETLDLLTREGFFNLETNFNNKKFLNLMRYLAAADIRLPLVYILESSHGLWPFFSDQAYSFFFLKTSNPPGISELKLISNHQTVLDDFVSCQVYSVTATDAQQLTDWKRQRYNKHLPLFISICTGLMESALIMAKRFADTRVQGGRRLNEWSMIKHKLFTLNVKFEKALQCSYLAENERLQRSVFYELISDLSNFGFECLRIHGGPGYIRDFPIERKYREMVFVSSLFRLSDLESM